MVNSKMSMKVTIRADQLTDPYGGQGLDLQH